MGNPISFQEERPPTRWLFVLLLLPCSAFLGYEAVVFAIVFATRSGWISPPTSGEEALFRILAALASVVLGSVGGLTLGGILSWRASHRVLARLTAAALALAALMVTVDILSGITFWTKECFATSSRWSVSRCEA